MKNLYCDEFILQNQDGVINVSTKVLKKKGYRNQEKRLIIFFTYNKGILVLRDSIKIVGKLENIVNINDKVVIRLNQESTRKDTYILGLGKVKNIEKINDKTYYEIIDLMFYTENTNTVNIQTQEHFSKKIIDMFEKFTNANYDIKEDNEIYDKYTKGLFKIYYDMLLIEIQNNNDITSSGNKASALASYLAINNNFKQNKKVKEKYELSLPNTFIQNCNIEFDAMILNKEENRTINEKSFFVSPERVKAVIEIKTSGIILSSKDDNNEYINILDEEKKKNTIIKDRFEKYITNNKEENEDKYKSNYNDLLENKGECEKKNIKYVYVAIHERTSNKQTKSIDYYNICRKTILEQSKHIKNKYYGIFCATSCDNAKYYYPIDYDMDKILEEILQ